MIRCDHCREEMMPTDLYCPNCGETKVPAWVRFADMLPPYGEYLVARRRNADTQGPHRYLADVFVLRDRDGIERLKHEYEEWCILHM